MRWVQRLDKDDGAGASGRADHAGPGGEEASLQPGTEPVRTAARIVALQRTAGNQATAQMLRRSAAATPVQRRLAVQGSWIGDRIDWVRTATRSGNWETADPPGAYYVLNGLSLDDMVRVLKALSATDRQTLAANLEDHGGGSDRPRIHLAISTASTPSADPALAELSQNLLWAIRSQNLTGQPDGAFALLGGAPAGRRASLIGLLNRDALDVLIDHRDEARNIPGAAAAMVEVERRRGRQGPNKHEQHLIDLVEGRDWTVFFTEFNGMQEFDQLRFLRGNQGVIPAVRDNIRRADGIADPVRIQYLLQRVSTPAARSLYADATVDTYCWQPKYRVANPADLSRIIQFGGLIDVEIDINQIGDDEMDSATAEQQFKDAKPGPGGLLWPANWNRSTLPVLWQVKQQVRRQQETILGDEVLAQGIFVVQYLMNVVFPVAQASAIRSLGALRSSRVMGRWMKGAQIVRTGGGGLPAGRGVWDLPAPARGRAAEALLQAQLPGEKFYGNFRALDRAVYSAQGVGADALEVGQLKSYDAVQGYARPRAFYNSLMKNAGELGGIGESTWSGGGRTVTIGPKTARVLDVAVPTEPLPAGNQAQLDAAIGDAKTIGVEIRVHRVQ